MFGILGECPGDVHDDHDGYFDVKRNEVHGGELWVNGGPALDYGDGTKLCHVMQDDLLRINAAVEMIYNRLSVSEVEIDETYDEIGTPRPSPANVKL